MMDKEKSDLYVICERLNALSDRLDEETASRQEIIKALKLTNRSISSLWDSVGKIGYTNRMIEKRIAKLEGEALNQKRRWPWQR